MPKYSIKEVQDHVRANGGTLQQLTNGNYNVRKGTKSVNIGKPDTSNKWDAAQLKRAWGDATDIPKID
ncbi:MAG TPA: hypothetical protein VH351_14315 [Bryobacteraceae bacterium]|jgi:hypothetical protein|nr:hypothetical protein [Bryobacteraceae bacterium]